MAYNRISPVVFESVSNVTSTNSVELGARHQDDYGEYVYVYNAGNEIWPGRCAYQKSGSSGYTISNTNTASQVGVFAGAVVHATITTGDYGWILTRGRAPVAPDTNEVSFDAGDFLAPGVDEGYVTWHQTVTSGAADGHIFSQLPPIGVCIKSGITSDGTVGVSTMGAAWVRSHVW